MLRDLVILALAAFTFVGQRASAQQWLRQLPERTEKEELTFRDFKLAFETYYKEHPVDLTKEKLEPTFRFEGAQEIRERAAIEQFKLFKRWEWFTEPRVYPTGKWDFETVDAVREKLASDDDRLVLKQTELHPLDLKIEQGKIVWPHLRFWRPLGPSDAIGGTNLGRVNSIQFDPTNSNIIYMGSPDIECGRRRH